MPTQREDLRHLPIVAIDPVDARDFDDAVWAAPDDDPANEGGCKAIVAIADVSYYVRPGSALDKAGAQARQQRLFPRSRRADAAAAPLVRHVLAARQARIGRRWPAISSVDKHGKLNSWRFTRAGDPGRRQHPL